MIRMIIVGARTPAAFRRGCPDANRASRYLTTGRVAASISRSPSPPFLPQGRRPHARCHPALPSAAPDRRHRPDPAAACTGRLTEADRTGPRGGHGQ
ncbi:hypothetical protein G6F32_015997 [Rhizopus arrhizus]|nr:hypothetical protein G6F32_015997 [Rhizopus arrhizus]